MSNATPQPRAAALGLCAAAAILLAPPAGAAAQRPVHAWTDGHATVRVGATARVRPRHPDRVVLRGDAGRRGPVRVDGVAGGAVNARSFGARCAGWVAPRPNHHVVVTSPVPRLRLAAERPGTTLVLRDRRGRSWCAVDRDGRGAVLEGAFAPGTYDVHVGTPHRGARTAYRLSVWDRPDRDRRADVRDPALSAAALAGTRWHVSVDGRRTDVVAFRRNGRVVGSPQAWRWAIVGDVVVVKDRRFRPVARLRVAPGPDGPRLRGRLAPALGGRAVVLRPVDMPRRGWADDGWRGDSRGAGARRDARLARPDWRATPRGAHRAATVRDDFRRHDARRLDVRRHDARRVEPAPRRDVDRSRVRGAVVVAR